MSVKKRFEAIWDAIRELEKNDEKRQPELDDKADASVATVYLGRRFRKPLREAFKKAGLDTKNENHWVILSLVFASLVYGKGPGRPKTQTKKKLYRLLKNVEQIKAVDARLSELDACRRLIKSRGRYQNANAKTLRRQLQTAKRSDNDAKLLLAAKANATATEMTKAIR
jgi:hypothetical protein